MDFFSNFDFDCLIKIFNFLPPEDISSLLLTCKSFDAIISKNSKLLKSFTLYLTKDRSGKKFRATRIYKGVKIYDTHGFLHIFDQIGEHIERLEVDCEDVNVSSLRKILLMCPELKEVTVRNFKQIQRFEDLDEVQPPKLNLQVLRHFSCHSILDLFEHSQVQKFEVFGYPKVAEDLEIFLQTQTQLLSLKLAHFYNDSTLFMSNALNSVKFKLIELKLHSFHKFDIEHLGIFLMNHSDTLTHVEVNNSKTSLFMILTHFMNLKSVEIRNIPVDFVEMPYVERLRVGHVTGLWETKFKNTKYVKTMRN